MVRYDERERCMVDIYIYIRWKKGMGEIQREGERYG